MVLPWLAAFSDVALLLLRLAIAALFASSGWSHLTRPRERAKSIELPPTATLALGTVELLCAASLALGIYIQIGALILSLVMLGAIYKKLVIWRTGFWGDDGQGWYYDLLYLISNLVILTTGGGTLVLT